VYCPARRPMPIILAALISASLPYALQINALAQVHPAPTSSSTRISQIAAHNEQLSAENKRLRDEIALIQTLVPIHQPLWQQNLSLIVSSLLTVIGLLFTSIGFWLALTSYNFTKSQAMLTRTMDMLQQWFDTWADCTPKGMATLETLGLDIQTPDINSVEKLGNQYEIIATAVTTGTVDRTILQGFGLNKVMCDFRGVVEAAALLNPTTDQQIEARNGLRNDLNNNWKQLKALCKDPTWPS
jgi:hypothetical protein